MHGFKLFTVLCMTGLSLLLGSCGGGSGSAAPTTPGTTADISTPVTTPQTSYTPVPLSSPKQLCIYYGDPLKVNGAATDAISVAQLAHCQLVVLGDGILGMTAARQSQIAALIATLKSSGTAVFGYIDLGVTTQNLNLALIQQRALSWKALGATGIFLDDAGYDYAVTRQRQTTAVTGIHGLQLPVMVNAWNPDDILGGLDERGGAAGSPLTAGDWFLLENWILKAGATNNLDTDMQRLTKAVSLASPLKVHLAGLSTNNVAYTSKADETTVDFSQAFWAAVMGGLSAWQWTDSQYSAADNVLHNYTIPPVPSVSFTEATTRTGTQSYSRRLDSGKAVVVTPTTAGIY